MRRNQVLSNAEQSIAAKLATKFTGSFEIAARLGTNDYEFIDEEGNETAKTQVVDLKSYHTESAYNDGEVKEIAFKIKQTLNKHRNITFAERGSTKQREPEIGETPQTPKTALTVRNNIIRIYMSMSRGTL